MDIFESRWARLGNHGSACFYDFRKCTAISDADNTRTLLSGLPNGSLVATLACPSSAFSPRISLGKHYDKV